MPHRINLALLGGLLLSGVVGRDSRGQDTAPAEESPILQQGGGLGGFGGVLPLAARDPTKLHSIKLPRENLAAVPVALTLPIGMAHQNRPVFEKLDSRRISLDVREEPLSVVLATVRDQAGCNVLIDRPALEEEGITFDTPISATLMDVALGQGLNRLLQPYNLTYVVTHGVLMITSQLSAGNELEFQVYPVGDLVWNGDVAGKKAIDFDPLIRLLEETISPNSWSQVGGAGSVRPFSANLSLAINQTQAVHQEIVDVLTALRQVRRSGESEDITPHTQELPKPRIKPVVAGIKKRESEMVRTMLEMVVSLSFDEVPLSDVIHFISDHSKLPFDVNKTALEEEGVNADTPVSIQVSGVGLGDALHLLLNQYNLTWIIKNDVIQITSQLDAGNELRTLSYPVGDLVVLSNGEERWSVFQCELQQLLQDVISPNSWSSVGGAGTMQYFAASQCLTVSQTRQVHEQMAALLATLRESSDRLSAIARAAGMPAPEELAEVRLRAIRAAAQSAEESSTDNDPDRAEPTRDEATDGSDPKQARRRAKLDLVRAQTRQAKAAAAKIEAELTRLKQRDSTHRDMSLPIEPNTCPYCQNPIDKGL